MSAVAKATIRWDFQIKFEDLTELKSKLLAAGISSIAVLYYCRSVKLKSGEIREQMINRELVVENISQEDIDRILKNQQQAQERGPGNAREKWSMLLGWWIITEDPTYAKMLYMQKTIDTLAS